MEGYCPATLHFSYQPAIAVDEYEYGLDIRMK